MRAIVCDGPGGPDVMRVADMPDPVPQGDDLLVRVQAAGVNRADVLQRRGAYPPPAGASSILGLEVAGEVVTGRRGWQPGDRVMAVIPGGGYAELAVVPVDAAMTVPAGLSYAQAAAIPEAFLTAYLNLVMLCQVRAGYTVLIHAGASGVGTAAVQLARQLGARAIVTVGTDAKAEVCLDLGAERAIVYTRESFVEAVREATAGRGVDVILDFIGAPYWNDNLAALAVGGRLAVIGLMGGARGDLDIGPILSKRLSIRGTTLRRLPADQKADLVREFSAACLPLFADDVLRPVLDQALPLGDASKAHARLEQNATIGKLVLLVD